MENLRHNLVYSRLTSVTILIFNPDNSLHGRKTDLPTMSRKLLYLAFPAGSTPGVSVI